MNMDDLANNDKSVLRAEDILPPYNKSSAGQEQNPQAQIPQFNLAEQILAEQRKVTATRRRRPADSSSAAVRATSQDSYSSGYIFNLLPKDPLEEQIIAEIVAKDIRHLCCD